MPRFISIAKAAQLANVPAKEVREKIHNKQLASTRGHIHIDDLIECYPQIHREEADMHVLVAKIKADSFATGAAKQHHELSVADLKQELQKMKNNADFYHERSQKFEELILQLRNNLEEMQQIMGKNPRVQALIDWLDHRIGEIHRNT